MPVHKSVPVGHRRGVSREEVILALALSASIGAGQARAKPGTAGGPDCRQRAAAGVTTGIGWFSVPRSYQDILRRWG